MSNLLTEYEDFKKEVAEAVNNHINSLPAIFIADFLDKMNNDIRAVAKEQLQNVKEKESEKDDSE